MHGREGSSKFVKTSVALSLLTLLLLTTIAFASISRMNAAIGDLEHKQIALFDEAWKVKYLDEALTHSATQYTLTKGDRKWKVRYDDLVVQLDAVLRHLQQNADPSVISNLEQVSTANDRLVGLETAVFVEVDKGEFDIARSLLAGPYSEQKTIYKDGIDRFFVAERANIDSQLHRAVLLSKWLRIASLIPGVSLAMAVLAIARGYNRSAKLAAAYDDERNQALRRQETEQRIHRALDLARNEPEVIAAARDILTAEYSKGDAEILLADSSRTHLRQVMSTDSTRLEPGCSVPTPEQCPAIRRGVLMVFEDPTNYSSCPHLRSRNVGGCHASCVPISLMGQTVGVLHGVTRADQTATELAFNARLLERLGNQVGDRVGVMRTLDRSQLQASTDSLTGLMNRRSLEQRVAEINDRGVSYSVAFFDLDHFKNLNDTYGHAMGDRSLQVFSKILRDALRTNDLICRWGGEEFVVALPDADANTAVLLSERIRESLVLALTTGSTPQFTTSAGVASWRHGEHLSDVVARADEALLVSKGAGRNRVTVAAPDGAKGTDRTVR
jgi:diguanylate cyclase (GGDEF)-like protein